MVSGPSHETDLFPRLKPCWHPHKLYDKTSYFSFHYEKLTSEKEILLSIAARSKEFNLSKGCIIKKENGKICHSFRSSLYDYVRKQGLCRARCVW